MKASDVYFNIFWSDEDEAFIAICPDFHGVSAFGDSEEHALAQVRIALKLAIETYEEEGWELPKSLNQDNF